MRWGFGACAIYVEGTWNGSFNSGTSAALQMTLQENASGTVSGNGNLSATSAIAFTVAGTYVDPNVSLTLSAPGFADLSLSAIVGQTEMRGTLNGSGFVNTAIVLSRQ